MAKKSPSIKIGGVEIKDHRTVSFTTALLIGLICFTVGALAYYVFMILPTKPGCVNFFVKTVRGEPVPNAHIKIYYVVVADPLLPPEDQQIWLEVTGPGGKATVCDIFEPNHVYGVLIYENLGDPEPLWEGAFMTNERRTADIPVRIRQQ